jgi:haloalkane dehalogenase
MVDHIPEPPPWVDRQAFPFRSRFLRTRAGRVHYVDEGPGDGQVVLLVHGTPSWSFEYRSAISALSRTRRVIACDHLGFGLSERPRRFAYTPEAHAEVLREVIDGLGLTRFSLVVHDFGGPIALPFAAEAPERITRLVVINSWCWRLADDPQLARAARLASSRLGRFMYRWLNASLRWLMPYAYADRRKLTPEIHAQYLAPFMTRDARTTRDARERVLWTLARALGEGHASLSRLWQDRERLAQIPALIIWGLGDRALPPRVLERLRQALPQARVAELVGVGHWPQEEAPAEVARLLDGFLPSASGEPAMLRGA